MAEVIHEHATENQGSGIGFFLGMIVLAVLLLLFFYYGLPILRQSTQNPQINVPGQIDVNINQPQPAK